jgi:hypothetical protein
MEERQGKSEINELLTLMAGDLMAGGQPRPGRQGIAIAASMSSPRRKKNAPK